MKYEGLSDELVKRLENLPPEEPRSRLEPLRELILAWRQQGRSYRRIQQLLHENARSRSPMKLCAASSGDVRDLTGLSMPMKPRRSHRFRSHPYRQQAWTATPRPANEFAN